MCVMMTEIQTIEGGQKISLLTRGDQITKKTLAWIKHQTLTVFSITVSPMKEKLIVGDYS